MNGSLALRRGATGAAVLAVALLALAFAQPAHAHAGLESTSPAEGALVTEPLHAVVLELSAPPRLAWLTLQHRDGTEVALGRPAMDGTRLTAAVGNLTAAGGYDLTYRVVAADGHTVEGSYSFEVAPAALTGAFAVSPVDDTELAALPARPVSVPALLLLGAVGAILASAVVRRSRSRRST